MNNLEKKLIESYYIKKFQSINKNTVNNEKNINNNKINNFQNEKINFNKPEKKNYIYMKDILKKAPLKYNYKCKKPFILDNGLNIQEKQNDILLNIKILVNNKESIISIRTNDDYLSIINLLIEKLRIDRNQIKKIEKDIQNALKIINNFSKLIINDESNIVMKNINDTILSNSV